MKKLYTAKDIEALLQEGGDPSLIPEGAMLTPSAKDLLRGVRGKGSAPTGRGPRSSFVPSAPREPIVPDYEFKWETGKDPKTSREIDRFFHSGPIQTLKERMAEIGDRMWKRGYTDGNGGNLTIRVGDNLFLCTPTLISKGFMTADDMCLIDWDGKQLAGSKKRTSEALTHLAIYKRQPKCKACCHAHPPHATAFAVAGVRPPTCLIPEAEVFLGPIGVAEYQTPGSPANAEVVGEAAVEHNAVLMINHGVITWGRTSRMPSGKWKIPTPTARPSGSPPSSREAR
jgi:L-fuculose-phosphate aldolase